MAVVVAYKVAPDPQDALVTPDGRVDWSRSRAALSPDDPAAIALGRTLADAAGVEFVGITVGAHAATPTARKAALGRGLDRVAAVTAEGSGAWRAGAVAEALAALAARVDADIVLTGDASVDENAHLVPALLAAHLGWPCLQGVAAVEPAVDGWHVTQATAGGVRVVAVEGPVVVSVLPDAVTAPAPGMKDLLAAARKPFEVVDVGPPAAPSPDVTGRRRPASRVRRGVRLEGPDAAARLAAALRSPGLPVGDHS